MSDAGERIEFENEKVRVIRVKINAGEKHAVRSRGDRVLIWLTDSNVRRTEPSKGKPEEFRRKAGEVAWRAASQHTIESIHSKPTEVIIVELKN